MKKNPQIVQVCERFDSDSQKDELIAALKSLCNDLNGLDSSDEETRKNDGNTVEGVIIIKSA